MGDQKIAKISTLESLNSQISGELRDCKNTNSKCTANQSKIDTLTIQNQTLIQQNNRNAGLQDQLNQQIELNATLRKEKNTCDADLRKCTTEKGNMVNSAQLTNLKRDHAIEIARLKSTLQAEITNWRNKYENKSCSGEVRQEADKCQRNIRELKAQIKILSVPKECPEKYCPKLECPTYTPPQKTYVPPTPGLEYGTPYHQCDRREIGKIWDENKGEYVGCCPKKHMTTDGDEY